MEKCFVKKYMGDTQDNNLPLYGDIILEARAITLTSGREANQSALQLGFSVNDTFTVSIEGDGYFAENYADLSDPTKRRKSGTFQGTITLPVASPAYYAANAKTLYFSNADYKIHICSKYKALCICQKASNAVYTVVNFNLEDFEYCLNMRSFSNNYNYTTIGNLSSLANLKELELIGLYNINTVKGNLNDIARLTKISRLYISGINSSKSNIEDFVQTQVSDGRTSVTTSSPLICVGVGTYVKFGGNDITGFTNNKDAAGYLTWEGTSKIVLYLNATDVTLANCSTIYAKGATAEEIAAWEGAGKTVVVIL